MDFNNIEELVLLCKSGDERSKEAIVAEFTPYIINLSKKCYIGFYDFEDIKNECYFTLFKCIKLYDTSKHRFVAYATNALRNSVNLLIRNSLNKRPQDGTQTISFDSSIDELSILDEMNVEELICNKLIATSLHSQIKKLSLEEQELIDYVYFKGYTFRKFAGLKNISYYKVIGMKDRILDKLRASTRKNSSVKHKLLN
ncbi:sigma-70 family RNA polymerase sigma factor [Clostridium sp. YIM B02505]|uniref:Sigma-70 family RNA polymerase sigma factor n=1 Tax=Clostridium yunnanense TaxID=2800325 RepID=A0ABS1EQD6_9CLOT|nr:sigma-70 family RNA polymerase sigma factor [Clostridium yunnanense]MBK1811612.1 sigma-70 family RNA polymerase sigma factor [Clostridium yunnanense]